MNLSTSKKTSLRRNSWNRLSAFLLAVSKFVKSPLKPLPRGPLCCSCVTNENLTTRQKCDRSCFKARRAFFRYHLIGDGLECILTAVVHDFQWLHRSIGVHLITLSAPITCKSAPGSTEEVFRVLQSWKCRSTRNSRIVIRYRGFLFRRLSLMHFWANGHQEKRASLTFVVDLPETFRSRDQFVGQLLQVKHFDVYS